MSEVAVVQAVESRVRRRERAIVRVSLDDSVRDAGRERAVRRNFASVHLEPRSAQGCLQVVFLTLEFNGRTPELTREREDRGHQCDHRIVRAQCAGFDGRQRRLAAVQHAVLQHGARCRLWLESAEGCLRDRVIRSQVTLEVRQSMGQETDFDFRRPIAHPSQLGHELLHLLLRLPVRHRVQHRQGPHGPGHGDRPCERAAHTLESPCVRRVLPLLKLDGGQALEDIAVRGAEIRIGGDRFLQLTLRVGLPGHDDRLVERLQAARVGLQRIRQAEHPVPDPEFARPLRIGLPVIR